MGQENPRCVPLAVPVLCAGALVASRGIRVSLEITLSHSARNFQSPVHNY